MSEPKNIELITSESGEWNILEVDGELFEQGHSISVHGWLNLVNKLGHEVSHEIISDEEMEELM